MALRNAFENIATEAKQTDLNALVTSLLAAAQAIQAAAEALNGKTTSVDTGDVTVSNMVTQPLTDQQLRASELPVTDEQLKWILIRMLDVLSSPPGFDSSQNRIRGTVAVESGTVTTVTTCATVTNLAQLAGRDAAMPVQALDDIAWYDCVRSRIS